MSDVPRHEYVLALGARASSARPDDPSVRNPTTEDLEALAELMLDAYLDTIDYDGETLEDAVTEVRGYFSGAPLLEHSWLRMMDGVPVSACLLSWWATRDRPIVSYVMTASAWKARGLASDLLSRSLGSLTGSGHPELRAVITEGNAASESIFARAGFRRV